MNKYVSIQEAEFENNPIYILCAGIIPRNISG